MEIIEIIEITIEEFENSIYKEYIKLFPDNEQREWQKIRETYKNGIEKFYKILLNNNVIGFIMLEKLDEAHPYYMDYFAIFEKYQKNGYGTKAIKMLLKSIVRDKGLCLEIEKEEDDNITTIKRDKFYKYLGFRKVDSEYVLYNVKYTPYIYEDKNKLNKDDVDQIMFDYYVVNCGEEEVRKNCKKIEQIEG